MDSDLDIHKLIYLRNNLEIFKLHAHNPEFDKLIPLIESNLESLQQIREKDYQSGNFPKDHFKLMDFGQFISVNMLDFLITFQSYFTATSKWGKNFFCRQLALLIYEFIDDIHATIKETLRTNEEIEKVDDTLKPKLNEIIKKLGFIKQLKYDDHLKEIRHQTAAHKEENIQELYALIKGLDEKLIIACSMFILLWITELFSLIKDIAQKLEVLRETSQVKE